jgi:hypothetical protein
LLLLVDEGGDLVVGRHRLLLLGARVEHLPLDQLFEHRQARGGLLERGQLLLLLLRLLVDDAVDFGERDVLAVDGGGHVLAAARPLAAARRGGEGEGRDDGEGCDVSEDSGHFGSLLLNLTLGMMAATRATRVVRPRPNLTLGEAVCYKFPFTTCAAAATVRHCDTAARAF